MDYSTTKKAWSDAETRAVISLWEEHLTDLRRAKRNIKIYTAIAEKLQALGFDKNTKEVKKKIENLGNKYRAIKRKQTGTGSGAISWPHYWDIQRFLGSLPLNDESLAEEGGFIQGSPAQEILVVAIGVTILTLAFCADVNSDRTYQGILLSMCGSKWRYASAVSVLLTCYGVCVTYLIVIGDQYDRIFASLHGPDFCHKWYMAREFTITLTAVAIVLPLNMLQHIEFLKCASSLGLLAVLYPCVLTGIAYFTEPRPDDLYIKVWPTSLPDVFLSTPVFCFAYQSHEVVISAYAAMRQRCLWNMAKAIAFCTVALFAIYSTVGCFGYLTYGAAVRPDIMEMFDATRAWVLIGLLALIFKMAVTYPLPALCARDSIEELYLELRGGAPDDRMHMHARKTKLSLAWFAGTVGVAILPVDIGVAIKFLGCLAALNVFVFPGMCLLGYTKLKGASTTYMHWHLLLGSFMVLAGAALFVVVLLHVVLVELVSGHANHLCS
ncbi:hypothetical protein HPB50_000625 [Hyalomma asiaticum]|uniref:Uncharacterized protein n=1 Tax=Hyalomma asiaticum TaxID=266040 RepID=A0ACB7TCR9_HYAAI|nr:hypothetical protein HPB50_000625 [Hyalomma asiaticum]